jgi:hypothetical protein
MNFVPFKVIHCVLFIGFLVAKFLSLFHVHVVVEFQLQYLKYSNPHILRFESLFMSYYD